MRSFYLKCCIFILCDSYFYFVNNRFGHLGHLNDQLFNFYSLESLQINILWS